jgi:two-component system sensor histidine kinase YesM
MFALIVLSIPSLFILGYLSFNIAKETLLETNTRTNQDHLQTSSEVADLLFRNIINLHRATVTNEQIRDDIRLIVTNDAAEPFEMKARIVNQLQRIVNNNFLDSRYVDSLCLFDLNYEAYCLKRSDDAGIYEGTDKANAIEQSEWYRNTANEQGRVVFFSQNVLGDSKQSFSTVKLFRDYKNISGEPLGFLVVNISNSIFSSIFTGNKNYGGEFLAIDSSKGNVNIVYPQKLSPPLKITSASLKETFDHFRELGYLISEYRNETTDWRFIHLVEVRELVKQSNKIGMVTAMIASTMAILALVFSYIISGSITRPLLQLKKMMVDWMKGSRHVQGTFEKDEIGIIGETFKRMVSENQELNEKLFHSELKEREAELRALQAQIKPHFLYNTLDSIYWMAVLQNNHDIAQMAVSLSESFKLSLNKGKETILVDKELKHIEHYMTIQNIRYNNRFKYIEDVDSSIKRVEILKLILQPLVENAIFHGLEPKVGEGTIRLSGRREGDFLLFIVEDDGVGIDDLMKTEQGYGLRNVRERILLYYGLSSTVTISSEQHKGTRIEIRFKLLQKEVKKYA